MCNLWERLREFGRKLLRLGTAAVFQNTGWLTGGQLAGDAASFIFFILLSRRFGPEGVGIYAFAVAVASVGRTIAELGVEDYGVRELANRNSESSIRVVGRVLGTQCWLVAIYAGGCVAFLAIAGGSVQEAVAIGLLGTYHLSAGVVRSLFLPAFAERRMAGPAVLEAGSRILAIVIGIAVMLVRGESLAEVLVGFPVCGTLLVAGGIWLNLQRLGGLRLQLDVGTVVSTAREAWPFAAGTVMRRLHDRADVVMLSLIAGSAATGIYAAGRKFVEVSMRVVPFFGFSLYPRLTRLAQEEKDRFDIAVNTLIKGGLVACILLGWCIFVIVPDLIPIFFGARFQNTEAVVKLFALWVPLNGVQVLGERLMLAAGKQVQRLRFQTIATGLNIAFNGALIPVLAAKGAIAASIISAGINAFLVARYLRRYSSEPLMQRLIVDVSPLLGAGLLAAGIAAYLGTAEVWAAVAFLISFVGAMVLTGFVSVMWTNITRLAGRSG